MIIGLRNEFQKIQTFPYKSVAYDVVRSAGEKVVPVDGKWMRWSRESHPTKGKSVAEVRWSRAKEEFSIDDILGWAESLKSTGLKGEMAIVDDEMDVTMYRIDLIEPTGDLSPATAEHHPLLGLNTCPENFCVKMKLTGWKVLKIQFLIYLEN